MTGPTGLHLPTARWRTRSRRIAYENPWIRVEEDVVELPNGVETLYGIVRCAPCVGVLPFVDDDHVQLVRQYRYVAGRPTWEMPTGGLHSGEGHEDGAQRELAEEAGWRAGRLHFLTRFDSSKSVVDETPHLFAALDLEPVPLAPDDTELIELRVWSFDDVVDLVAAAAITDAMTVIAVLTVERLRRQSSWPPPA